MSVIQDNHLVSSSLNGWGLPKLWTQNGCDQRVGGLGFFWAFIAKIHVLFYIIQYISEDEDLCLLKYFVRVLLSGKQPLCGSCLKGFSLRGYHLSLSPVKGTSVKCVVVYINKKEKSPNSSQTEQTQTFPQLFLKLCDTSFLIA